MRYKTARSFAVMLMLSVTAVPGRLIAAPPEKATTQREMQSVDYLLGTWNCTHTVGTFSGTYTTTFSRAHLGDFWLKQTYDFPPQKTADRNDPRITAEALMGFDEPRQTWVRFFANSLGQYFSIRMTDTENGWAWKYSTFFVRTKPETPDPDAKFTKKSNTEYTIEGPTYPEGGTLVTEHHTCHKM